MAEFDLIYDHSVYPDGYGAAGLAISTDGTRVFYGQSATGIWIEQYNLSVPLDITSATYIKKAYGGNGTDYAFGGGLVCKPDMSSIFVFGVDDIFELSFGTPGEIDTLSFVKKFTSSGLVAGTISPDGAVIYYFSDSYRISRRTLSTPWDLDSVSAEEYVDLEYAQWNPNKPRGILPIYNGNTLLVTDRYNMHVFNLPSPYALPAASHDNVFLISPEGAAYGLSTDPDNSFLYVAKNVIVGEYSRHGIGQFELNGLPISDFWTNFIGQTETLV
jgi:hypothetical protein